MVTIGWNKLCKPLQEGVLGLRSLITLNEYANLKLCWDFRNYNNDWATILKSIFSEVGKQSLIIFTL
jgi:hypothetical protein